MGNYQKRRKLKCFYRQVVVFSMEKRWKTCFSLQKWLDRLLLMTSYLVTIAIYSHQACVKMCVRHIHTTTVKGRCWGQTVLKNFKKNIMRGWHASPFPTVRPWVKEEGTPVRGRDSSHENGIVPANNTYNTLCFWPRENFISTSEDTK